jgi:hypothetical protein
MKIVRQTIKRFGIAIAVLIVTGASFVIWWFYKGLRKK